MKSSTSDSFELSTEPVFFTQTWDLSYRHALGKTVGGFLEGLKSKKLLGRRCNGCDRVLFPARSFCDRCHLPTEDWVVVQPHGKLQMFTIVYEDFPGMRVKAPYVLAYAMLDGADTAAVGYIKGLDLSDVGAATQQLSIAAPLDVHFADEPTGQITDFWYEVSKE
jgi:hypothetical protein